MANLFLPPDANARLQMLAEQQTNDQSRGDRDPLVAESSSRQRAQNVERGEARRPTYLAKPGWIDQSLTEKEATQTS